MPTYNKEKYIAKALDSILMQETTYKYKIIITDDCSSDKTLEIAKEYSNANPGVIEILCSEINQKLYKNIARVYDKLQTPYFCVLDPDDYWLDKKKIQKALDFLESHKEYTIYCANTLLIKEDSANESIIDINNLDMKNYSSKQDGGGGVNAPFIPLYEEKTFTFEDYLHGHMFSPQTSSVIYRNVIFINGLPNQMRNLAHLSCEISYRGDSFRNVIHLHEGKLYYKPEIVAVYLLTDSGIWQSLDDFNQLLFNCMFYKNVWLYFDKKYPELLIKSYNLYCDLMCRKNLEQIFKQDEAKLCLNIKALQDIYIVFVQNKSIIESFQKKETTKLGMKYKIFLSLYERLYKKLIRKKMSWLFKDT